MITLPYHIGAYHIEAKLCQLSLEEYLAGYFDPDHFMSYCQSCSTYLTNWSCPPFDFNIREILSQLHYAHIFVHKVTPDRASWAACLPTDVADYCYQLMGAVRDCLDPQLYELERRHEGSRLFTAGRCRLCRPHTCTRSTGTACRHPETMRSSLEAWGFDLGATTERLAGIPMVWGEGGHPPRYLTMVSALLSVEPIATSDLAEIFSERG